MKKKVILGLSGGVDSSVAAYLLQKDGFNVEAVFMRNWDSATNQDVLGNPTINDEVCEQERDYQDALSVANHLGIILHKVDFVDQYWKKVFEYFLSEYRKNRTPNPDVLCNNEIKFKAFLDYANTLDADYIAMGHYAKVGKHNSDLQLLRGKDQSKDQSYFLSQLSSEQLEKVMFPLGNLTKKEVREIAEKAKLPTANKKDSTGICFIGERNFADFLANYLPAMPGEMKTLENEVIGKHYGLMNYTIGQRKGLGIGGIDGRPNLPWFVVGKEMSSKTLFVEQGYHHGNLYSNEAIITDVVWRGSEKPTNLTAKFRYRQADEKIQIKWLDETTIKVIFDQPIRAVTPGQACAFYELEVCLGGGFIDEVFMDGEKRQYS